MEEDLRVRRLLDIPGRPEDRSGHGSDDRDGPQPVLPRAARIFRPVPGSMTSASESPTANDRTVDFEQTDRKRLNDKAVLSRSHPPPTA
jgi:hypothetical protein